MAGCLAIYIGFMHGYPVPPYSEAHQCGRGDLSPECNFGAYLDRAVFGTKYMMYPNDPEGIFTTLSSFTNTFAGLCFSLLMRYNTSKKGNNVTLVKYWLGLAASFGAIGGLMTIFEPVCKKRWSASFAFLTSAYSGFLLCLCFFVVDILNKPFIKEKLALPFLWLGMNPLFIFVAMIFADNLVMNNISYVDPNGKKSSLWGLLYVDLFLSWIGNEYVASLLFSFVNLLLWLLAAYALYKRKIFIKL